jgi:hypothetical protein
MTYLFKNSKTRKIIHENDKSNKNKTDDGVETTKTKSREIQMEEQAKYPLKTFDFIYIFTRAKIYD